MADRMMFDDLDGEVVEKPGMLESLGRGSAQGLTLGFGDEMGGFFGALGHRIGRDIQQVRQGKFLYDDPLQEAKDTLGAYRKARDESRMEDTLAELAHPTAYFAGELGGGAAPGLLTGGGGALGAAKSGAKLGAAAGLGSSQADLTRDDVENYARAFGDTLKGGAFGAATGAAMHGAGAGLKWAGGKARGALEGARGQLADDALAQVVAEEEARAAAAQANRSSLEKMQGSALEMNKRVDAATARKAAQEAVKAARASRRGAAPRGPGDLEDTGVLKGYEGGAHRRRVDNSGKVLQARERLAREDITPQERAELEAYVSGHGDAVDNPVAFRLRIVREDMLRRGATPAEADRIISQRFGPKGEALSRGARPPAVLPERTQSMDLGDAVRQGRGEEMARAGGGGYSAFGDDFANAPTRASPLEFEDSMAAPVDRPGLPPGEEVTQAGAPDFFGPEHFEATNPGVARPRGAPSPLENYARQSGLPLPESAPEVRAPMGAGGEPVRGPSLTPGRPVRREGGMHLYDLEGNAPGRQEMPTVGGANAQFAMRRALAAEARVGRGEPLPPATPSPSSGEPTANIRRPVEAPTEGAGFFEEPTLSQARGPAPESGLTMPYGGRERLQAPPPAAVPAPQGGLQPRSPAERPAAAPDLQDFLTQPGVHPELRDVRGRVAEREAGAMGRIARAGFEGLQAGNNILGGALGAMRGVTREALRDPAVKARALSALKLHALERLDPATFARVGTNLQRAMERGPEHAKATRHVYLQTDPRFREADRRAEEELANMDDDALLRLLQQSGAL